jgi:hypothetical protein
VDPDSTLAGALHRLSNPHAGLRAGSLVWGRDETLCVRRNEIAAGRGAQAARVCTELTAIGLAMLVPAVVVIALVRYDRTSRWIVWAGALGGAIVVALGQTYGC